MAFRAACCSAREVGIIACGGDVPPELSREELRTVRRALIGRGTRDGWYTAEKLAADDSRLRAAGVDLRCVSLDAGHEWPPAFSAAAGEFLDDIRRGLAHASTSSP
jgi:predicted esterase